MLGLGDPGLELVGLDLGLNIRLDGLVSGHQSLTSVLTWDLAVVLAWTGLGTGLGT